jgi:hypothetical protein
MELVSETKQWKQSREPVYRVTDVNIGECMKSSHYTFLRDRTIILTT